MTEETPPQKSELEFMMDAESWPNWPVLPVKNLSESSNWRAGMLVQLFPLSQKRTEKHIFFLPDKNMWDEDDVITLGDAQAGRKLITEADFQQVLDEGWVVD